MNRHLQNSNIEVAKKPPKPGSSDHQKVENTPPKHDNPGSSDHQKVENTPPKHDDPGSSDHQKLKRKPDDPISDPIDEPPPGDDGPDF
jgi:hypothetical protein